MIDDFNYLFPLVFVVIVLGWVAIVALFAYAAYHLVRQQVMTKYERHALRHKASASVRRFEQTTGKALPPPSKEAQGFLRRAQANSHFVALIERLSDE